MNDNLKFDESQKKRCWGCAFFSTSPNWAPVGSGSSEYSCYLHGGSNIRKVGSGSCFCDCWEKKLIDTEGYDVESDKSYYEASEVHEAIRELKKKFEMLIADKDAEIAELKQELSEKDKDIAYWREEYDKETQLTDALKDEIESLKASHYAEMVDAGMRERKLKRALWLARAERAIAEAEYWYEHKSDMYYIDATDVPDEEDDPYKRVKDTTIGWCKTWMNVERKCREKAEEYE